jgi:hypothetical protein
VPTNNNTPVAVARPFVTQEANHFASLGLELRQHASLLVGVERVLEYPIEGSSQTVSVSKKSHIRLQKPLMPTQDTHHKSQLSDLALVQPSVVLELAKVDRSLDDAGQPHHWIAHVGRRTWQCRTGFQLS